MALGSPGRRFGLALVAALLLAAPAAGATYGDVEITVESEPRGPATHGYAEVWVRVANKSTSASHAVRLTYPRSSYSVGADYLRAVTRTVTVEPGKVARVALAFPERLVVNGGDLGVAFDGSEQEEGVRLGTGSRGYGSPGRGGYGGSGSGPQPLVLYSLAVDTRFPDWVQQTRSFGPPAGMTFSGGQPECVRADRPAESWSPNWLGYSRYDGVVVTPDDVRRMPAEVKAAVAQYVECGGSLLVFGGDPADLPSPWKPEPGGTRDLTLYSPGFGQCLQTRPTEFFGDNNLNRRLLLRPALESWTRTLTPWQRAATPGEANRRFPVVEDLGVPTTGLLSLMFLFALVIGPVNLYVLARRRRKLWLFWTVPAFSLLTCLLVFGYMAVAEGWQGRARVEGFTILDENTRRASTLGWNGFYTPLVRRGGLHYGADTEVTLQNAEDHRGYYNRRAGSALTIDWTHEQNLASGWLSPRVPAHFFVRKGEQRRERVTFTRAADGRVEAVNGLGADLTDLWYADESGTVFRAQNISAGGRATLSPVPGLNQVGTVRPRDIYTGDVIGFSDRTATDGSKMLTPRTYFGIMDAAPFLDDPLPDAARKVRSAVLGIIREGPDGG